MVLVATFILFVWMCKINCVYGNAYHTEQEAKLMSHVNISKLHALIDQPFDAVVDAPISKLLSVFHSGNLCPFRRKILTKMQNNEPINIHILGGSVTIGADLRNPKAQRWSTIFEEIMNGGWYGNRINVVNQAIPACNIDSWVNMAPRFKDADLVIVDSSVNDQGFDLQVLPHYYTTLIHQMDKQPNRPALLFHQAFRSAQNLPAEVEKHCPNDYTTCCSGVMFCRKWWEMHDYVTTALHRYHVPYVSYRNLVWPDYNHPANNLNEFWNGLSHPDYKAHHLMAKLISTGIMTQIRHAHHASCDDPNKQQYVSPHLVDNSTRSACASPMANMMAGDSALSEASFNVASVGSYWRFYSESKNKFGWILETNKTSMKSECGEEMWCDKAMAKHTLTLKITLSEKTPVVQLRFLRSYSPQMGTAKIWLDDKVHDAVEINSRWDMPYSVMQLTTLAKEKLHINSLMLGEEHVFSSLSGGEHLLSISGANMPGENFKWKLLGLTTC